MAGFGDLFGGLGELLKTFGEAAHVGEETGIFEGGEGGMRGEDANATYDRVLAGGKRELNINDR